MLLIDCQTTPLRPATVSARSASSPALARSSTHRSACGHAAPTVHRRRSPGCCQPASAPATCRTPASRLDCPAAWHTDSSPIHRHFDFRTSDPRCTCSQRQLLVSRITVPFQGPMYRSVVLFWQWHDTHLMAIFQENPGKPVPECLHSANSVKALKGKKYHIPWTCSPQVHLGSFNLVFDC